MSLSNSTPANHFGRHSNKGCCMNGNWSGLNIAAMVVAFIIFWPIGLVVLYWNIRGRDVKDLPSAMKEKWSSFIKCSHRYQSDGPQNDNVVFNEYQQTQYERINEIKEEIKNRAKRFYSFKRDVKRRADEKEFKDFMSNNPDSDENNPSS